MKLYFSPGACSLAPHIVLRECGFEPALESVDLRAKTTQSGADFTAINPKGSVPALELDNKDLLTEGSAILQYIADQAPERGLAPAAGTMARYRFQEWLNYIATEIHKGFSPLFNPATPDAFKAIAKENLAKRFDYLSTCLGKNEYLMGSTFCAADAYLYTVLNWCRHVGMDLAQWPVLQAYNQRIAARPAVQAALQAEGLLRAAA